MCIRDIAYYSEKHISLDFIVENDPSAIALFYVKQKKLLNHICPENQ